MRFDRPRLLRGAGRAAAFVGVAVLVGGGWYLANLVRYDDLLGTAPHFESQVALARFGWHAALSTLQSYWAAFGWALITAPWWAYVPVGLAVGLGLAGCARALMPGGRFWTQSSFARRALGLLGLAFATNLVAFVRWATATGAPYGRLLFPTAGAVGIVLAWGLAQWRPARSRCFFVALSGSACLVVVLLPWILLRPAFRSPYLPRGVPASATAVADVRAADVRLAGMRSRRRRSNSEAG